MSFLYKVNIMEVRQKYDFIVCRHYSLFLLDVSVNLVYN